jgi:hypothetical protein
VLWALQLFVGPIIAGEELSSKDPELDARIKYWSTQLPFCNWNGGGNFPSKYYQPKNPGQVEGDSCNDGDSVLFNGLMCSIPDNRGCDAVKRSQARDGMWWRSPKKEFERLPSDQTNFSGDHALGVMAYIAQTQDRDAFRRWIAWIVRNPKFKGVVPRYCDDDDCAFKPIDCPLLDRLALYLGEANPACDFAPIDPNEVVQKLQTAFDGILDDLKKIPGSNLLFPDIADVKRLFDEAMKPLVHFTGELEKIRQKHDTFVRATSGVANIITLINSQVNDAGFPRHDVAVEIYFLRKYGGVNFNALSEAAKSIWVKDKQNAFFEYLAHGKTSGMRSIIISPKCPSQGEDTPHARFQWTWERDDREQPPPWKETMYWDCLFELAL